MADTILLDSHRPALDSGDYKIKISQTLIVQGNSLTAPSPEIEFRVEAEKYSIDPLQIDSVFPPAAGMGDFSLLFPHIILNRSTLPWERAVKANQKNIPWLALIILNEDEIGDFNKDATKVSILHFKRSDWEASIATKTFADSISTITQKDELISIIASKPGLFKDKILPTIIELPYLAHVRKTGDEEKAVVVCNRLPSIDKKNTVHLVSLENCYDSGIFSGKTDKDGNIAIVTLKSWEFFCNDHFILTEEVITNSQFSNDLKNALLTIKGSEYFNDADLLGAIQKQAAPLDITPFKNDLIKAFRVGHLPDILKHLNRTPGTLRRNSEDELSKQGFITIPYILKTGKAIEAVYSSPLTPVANPVTDNSIITLIHSDEALSYFSDTKKLNVTYASAWELGKMLALQNKNFSVALYKWKRTCYQSLKTGMKISLIDHTPPAIIRSWFNDLENLSGIVNDLKAIPFNYLVPDPSLIPFESIRFFNIDLTWLKYFVDGAFSIGRISKAEQELDKVLYNSFDFLKPLPGARSGFLLHSVAVAGWPDMNIYNQLTNHPLTANIPTGYHKCANEGESFTFKNVVDVAFGINGLFKYKEGVTGTIIFNNETFGDPAPNVLKAGYYRRPLPYRKDKLSANLLICLFDGSLDTVCIHQKPGSVHFGLQDDEAAKAFDRIASLLSASTKDSSAKFAKTLIQKIEVIKFKI